MSDNSLFNHYGAWNRDSDAHAISDFIDEALKNVVANFGEKYPLHEIESIAFSTLSGIFAEARLRRGMRIKKEEKSKRGEGNVD